MPLAAPIPSPIRRTPRSRSGRRILAVLAAAVPLLLALAGQASAVPAGPAAAPLPPTGATAESATAAALPPATATPHCALVAGSSAPHCFATYRAAVAYGTGGRVTDAPVSARTAALDPAFARKMAALPAGTPEVAAAASVLLGVEYADAGFSGASLSLFGAGGCDNSSDVDFRFGSMPAGWNDRISSFKSFSNCAQQLFRSVNFTGGSLTLIISSLSYVGAAANDQASSVTFN
jgi:hypothetical protein